MVGARLAQPPTEFPGIVSGSQLLHACVQVYINIRIQRSDFQVEEREKQVAK